MPEVRLPPHDLAAEKAVIGCVMRDSKALVEIGPLPADDFYAAPHQLLWRAVGEMDGAQTAPDPVTLANWVKDHKAVADIGGYGYLVELFGSAPTIQNAAHYADIVRQKATLRRLAHACRDIEGEAMAPGADAVEVLEKAERAVFEIGQQRRAAPSLTLKEVLDLAIDNIDRKSEQRRNGKLSGVPSGWIDLDKLTAGWQPGELVLVAARPSAGKTSFAGNLFVAAAADYGLPVLFFSLEQAATAGRGGQRPDTQGVH
jgi:replicative DNA helicase